MVPTISKVTETITACQLISRSGKAIGQTVPVELNVNMASSPI